MANYDIEARVRLVAGQALKGLQDLEQKAKKLQKSVEQLGDTKFNNISKGATGARKQVNDLYKAFQKLNRIGKISGLVGTTAALNAFGEHLAGATAQTTVFGKTFETGIPVINQMGSAVESLTHFMAPLVHQLQAVGAQGQAVAAGLGIATAAAVAFAPQVSRLGAASRPLVEQLNQLRHKLFDFVEGSKTAIQFTGNYRDVIRSVTDNITNLTTRQQNAKRTLNGLNSTSEEAAQVARTLVSLNSRLNRELANQETLLKNVANAQRTFNDQARVRANIARSSFGREGSGFGAFSQAASRVADQNAIDKAIRRNRDRIAKAFKGMEPIQAPLMLPSSEMLNAAERGIRQLSGFYGDLNTQIDTGVQAGRAFTEQLNAQAARSKTLPPIFNDVGRALEATVNTTEKVFTNTQQTAKAVTNTAKARGDAIEAALQEGKVLKTNKQITKEQNDLLKERNRLQAETQKSRGRMLENLALGAGFPLLFGGGVGATGGALAGSFFGQGFGGQILGSAIGQILDDAAKSLGELGRALQPLTADLDAITKAAGLTGTSTERLIKELEDAGLEAQALQMATEQLAFVVGAEGVRSLKDFGDQTQELANEFDKLLTQIGVGLAALLEGPVAALLRQAEIQTSLNIARTSKDPELQALNKALRNQGTVFNPGTGVLIDNTDRVEIESRIVDRVKELRAEQARTAQEEAKRVKLLDSAETFTTADLNLATARRKLQEAGNDLTNAEVYALSKKVILAESYVALQGHEFDLAKKQTGEVFARTVAEQERGKLAELDRKRQEAFDRKARDAARATGKAGRAQTKEEKARAALAIAQQQATLAGRLMMLERQIGEARVAGNDALAEALRIEAILEQKASRIAEIKAGTADDDIKTAQIAQASAEAQRQLDSDSFRRQQATQDRIKAFEDVKTNLDLELRGVQAISTEQQDALRLYELELQFKARGKDLTDQERAAIKGKIADIRKANEALTEQEFIQNNLNQLVNTAGQQFSGLFQNLITGTNNWNDALRNTLNTLANALVRFGINALGGSDGVGFFSMLAGTFSGGKAKGGPVSSGRSYMVGERGPELFMPNASGTIVPNNALGGGVGNITVNVEAGGTSVQGDQPNANKLGQALGAAVRAELVKQKRPGGLLA